MADLLALLTGKGKPKGDADMGGKGMGPSRPGESFAREAFSALKDDDEEGFVEAFLGAVDACKGDSEPDADDEGDYQDEG